MLMQLDRLSPRERPIEAASRSTPPARSRCRGVANPFRAERRPIAPDPRAFAPAAPESMIHCHAAQRCVAELTPGTGFRPGAPETSIAPPASPRPARRPDLLRPRRYGPAHPRHRRLLRSPAAPNMAMSATAQQSRSSRPSPTAPIGVTVDGIQPFDSWGHTKSVDRIAVRRPQPSNRVLHMPMLRAVISAAATLPGPGNRLRTIACASSFPQVDGSSRDQMGHKKFGSRIHVTCGVSWSLTLTGKCYCNLHSKVRASIRVWTHMTCDRREGMSLWTSCQ
jgi:hypothetical protein